MDKDRQLTTTGNREPWCPCNHGFRQDLRLHTHQLQSEGDDGFPSLSQELIALKLGRPLSQRSSYRPRDRSLPWLLGLVVPLAHRHSFLGPPGCRGIRPGVEQALVCQRRWRAVLPVLRTTTYALSCPHRDLGWIRGDTLRLAVHGYGPSGRPPSHKDATPYTAVGLSSQLMILFPPWSGHQS